jgi:hypothetical protein
MDEILRKMNELPWLYADKDPKALAIVEERLAKAGRSKTHVAGGSIKPGWSEAEPQVDNR